MALAADMPLLACSLFSIHPRRRLTQPLQLTPRGASFKLAKITTGQPKSPRPDDVCESVHSHD